LFAGGIVGYCTATLATLGGFTNVPVTNMIIVGMAGVMSGVLYAPLTAIFLIAESSSGYDLFIPLMIVSVISFLIVKRFAPISPDLKNLADQGKIFTREHDRNLLSLIPIAKLIDRDIQLIPIQATFYELIDLIKRGKHNFIAVIDKNQNIKGIVTMDRVRPLMFDKDQYGTLTIREVMTIPPAFIDQDADTIAILKKFDETNTWYLPIVNQKKLVGFISKSKILDEYRQLLKAYS
jgi:CIC family chloride channel protein